MSTNKPGFPPLGQSRAVFTFGARAVGAIWYQLSRLRWNQDVPLKAPVPRSEGICLYRRAHAGRLRAFILVIPPGLESVIGMASSLTSCSCATGVKDLSFVYRRGTCSPGLGLVQPIKPNEHLLRALAASSSNILPAPVCFTST